MLKFFDGGRHNLEPLDDIRCDLRMGWLRVFDDDIPDTVEFMVSFRDHRLNEGWGAGDEAAPAVVDR